MYGESYLRDHTCKNVKDGAQQCKMYPQALYKEINLMGNNEKSAFIIVGMRITYTEEWEEIYVCLANHIYAMYKANVDLNNWQQ